LPSIQEWALDEQYLGKEIEVLPAQTMHTVTLPAAQVRHILANSFFGYVGKGEKAINHRFGILNFWKLYTIDDKVSIARILCLLCYFYTVKIDFDPNHIISFQRISLYSPPPQSSGYTGTIPPDWQNIPTPINTDLIHMHNGRMEDATEATAFVDFANRDLHIHQVIASATQEEVLFSCCPEAFPGILFCERLQDNEAIIIRGCRRFCDYTGYLYTFNFKKAFIPPLPPQDIIAIDAVYASHFREAQNIRDLNKAFLGFLQCAGNNNKISTGYWGCGAFGGDKVHKFLQQVCVSTVTNAELHFSAYQETTTWQQLQFILQELREIGATVSEVFTIIISYKNNKKTFFDYMTAELAQLKLTKNLNNTNINKN